MSLRGDIAYVSGWNGFSIVDLSDTANPTIINSVTSSFLPGIASNGDVTYLATSSGVSVYNTSNPSQPVLVHQNQGGISGLSDLAIDGNILYACSSSLVKGYTCRLDGSLEVLGSLKPAGAPLRMTTKNDQLLIAERSGGVSLVRLIDREAPTLNILFPTGQSINVDRATVSIAGLAADDHEIRSVTWSSSSGGNGSASGTHDWSIVNIPLSAGANTIEVTVTDGFGNATTQSVSVFYETPDEISPILIVDGQSFRSSNQSTITISGTATDFGRGDSGISSVLVGNIQAENDYADVSGTATWSVDYPLQIGENFIIVETTDGSAAENATTQTITVIYEPDASTYEGWLAINNIPSDQSGANDDPLRIGITNLVAFALGIDPAAPEFSRLPFYEQVEIGGLLYHSLLFERSTTVSSVQFHLQRAGGNLSAFTDEPNTTLEVIDDSLIGSEKVRLRCIDPILMNEKSQYLRLKISE